MKLNIYIKKAKNHMNSLKNKTAAYLDKSATLTIAGKSHKIYPVKLAFAAAAVIIVVWLMLSLFIGGSEKHKVNIPFEAGSPYRVYSADEDVLVYNNRGAKAVNKNGKLAWSAEAALSEPMIDGSGEYTLLCDLAGNHFAASYKNGKQIYEYKLGNDIISAKITGSGYTAFATDTDGYKGRVTVYNKRGKELYVWNSGGGYITDIDLTENGRYIAAAQLSSNTDKASTKLQFIDTRRGKVVATAEREGEIAVNIKFLNDNKLIMVTDSSITGYTKKGKELFNISLKGKSPSYYNIDSDKLIAVVTLDNRGNSVLEMYNYSGRFCGMYTSTGDIRHIGVSGKKAYIAEQRGIVCVNARGKVKEVTPVDHDIMAIGGFADGGHILSVGTTQAEVIER